LPPDSCSENAMNRLDQYLEWAEQVHGHLCPGQILGVRMALYALELLGIEAPHGKDRKRLITFVETDRCLSDAIMLVTGCRLGKRALKFRDFGKPAATFWDLQTGRAVRLLALESAKDRARELYPDICDPRQQQSLAYRHLPNQELFQVQWVRVQLPAEDLPGYRGAKVICARCGEPISFRREVWVQDGPVCRACAGEAYYQVEAIGDGPQGHASGPSEDHQP